MHSGSQVAHQEFVVLIELLMRQLLKLDGIEAEGEAKVQRKNEVSFFFLWFCFRTKSVLFCSSKL